MTSLPLIEKITLAIKNNKIALAEEHDLPSYLKNNIKYPLRTYQYEALKHLECIQDNKINVDNKKHFLFHMATGTGKTIVMATTILFLFKKYNYKNFMFFVHADSIIKKTNENLFNTSSSKYLFNEPINIDGENIAIIQVESFPSIQQKNTIYIKTSTINKIHYEINNLRENKITYEDLKDKKIVLLGDEAHHFSAKTKSKKQMDSTWEDTIENILALNKDNLLLEFTATINLCDSNIWSKYKNKIIYQYDINKFMRDGYSKQIVLMQTNDDDNAKMLDAILLSQYKKMIAYRNNIQNFKPIILFKSSRVSIAKERQLMLIQLITMLSPSQIINHLHNKKSSLISDNSIWVEVIHLYMNGDLIKIIKQIQDDFHHLNIINVNDPMLSKERMMLLNSLESIDNPVRAIFAVEKMNEGWDVLNLYDIVRLNEISNNNRKNTNGEAQLIGRGARYYPFYYNGEQSYTRRFDCCNHPIRVIEQLHYHTINEQAYIKSLYNSLKKTKIPTQTDGEKIVELAKLKESFKKSNIYNNEYIYFNQVEKEYVSKDSWSDYSLDTEFNIQYTMPEEKYLNTPGNKSKMVCRELRINFFIYIKAIQRIRFYEYRNIKHYFPKLKSIRQFINDSDYLGRVKIILHTQEEVSIRKISPKEKLKIVEGVLINISETIKINSLKQKGTSLFIKQPVKKLITDYAVHIKTSNFINQKITAENTNSKPWYVFDNAILNQLEHKLINALDELIYTIKPRYSEVFLIRNDERTAKIKLTEFNGVRGFMPDFIMLLTAKNSKFIQVFIEAKGENRCQEDAWKEKMLNDINVKNNITVSDDVKIIGVRFYNHTSHNLFITELRNKLQNI